MTLCAQRQHLAEHTMTDNKLAETYENDAIDLFELWETLVDGKWLVLACTAVCFIAATTLAFIMTPKYEARVVSTYSKDDSGGSRLAGQFGGLADLAGISLGSGGDGRDAALAFLQSRALLDHFIAKNEVMPALYAKLWDSDKKTWNVAPEEQPTPYKAYQFFSKTLLNIAVDKKTGLITLSITWKDREQAVRWANMLMREANEQLRQKTISETQQSIDFLEKELQKTSVVEVQNTIFRVMENQIKTMMMANTQEQFAFKIIDPAVAMDEDAFVKPKRPLMMALGLIGGLFLGILAVFLRKAVLNHRAQRAASAS